MTREEFEAKGDLHKKFENLRGEAYLIPQLPTIIRVDGKSFHTFTKGLDRPFDKNLSLCMQETAMALLAEFHADVVYTQSDEISLGWMTTPEAFAGRIEKLLTLTSAAATSQFMLSLSEYMPNKMKEKPKFDSRVTQYPSLALATDYFVWRSQDAERNSLTMLAHSFFGKKIEKKGYAQKHEMLHSVGVNWNDYPVHFKRGIFVKKLEKEIQLTPEELKKIPEQHRPTGPVLRSVIEVIDVKPVLKEQNLSQVLWS